MGQGIHCGVGVKTSVLYLRDVESSQRYGVTVISAQSATVRCVARWLRRRRMVSVGLVVHPPPDRAEDHGDEDEQEADEHRRQRGPHPDVPESEGVLVDVEDEHVGLVSGGTLG